MKQRKNLIGEVKDRLTIISFIEKRGKHLYWKAKCICGNETKICSTNFSNKKTASCGCFRNEKSAERLKNLERSNTLPRGEGSLSCLINNYRQGAKNRKLNYELTRDQFRDLTKRNCYYCGKEPNNKIKGHRSNGEYIYNGIDRKDNNRGYDYFNCVSCCAECNRSKLDNSYYNFINWVEKIANHLLKTGDIQLDVDVYEKLELVNEINP